MAHENIKLNKSTQANFTVNKGYFFTFDYSQDNLLQKTDDGNTAFSYPFDVLLDEPVKSAEFDGVYFWSLENPSGEIRIKRWKLDNYLCKLQQSFIYTDNSSHTYDSNAFSIEHYHTTFKYTATSGTSYLYMSKYSDDSTLMGFTTTSGDGLRLHLGPNSNGEEEDVTVSGVVTVSGAVVSGVIDYRVDLTQPLQFNYSENDEINFYTYIWVFNNYDGTNSSRGALYKFDAYTGDYITRYAGGAYKNITAATFYNVPSFTAYGNVDTLCYVKSTNILFVNVHATGSSLPYYGSMVMENIQSDERTVIPIYDLAMDSKNIYRLQDKPDGTSTTWSAYSYILSSLDSFVTSISLAAYPAVLAANTISTANIVAIVKDQFLQPVSGRLVYFSDDDPVGSITGGTPKSTDSEGKAETVYTSGDSAREVKITARVEQT